MRRLLHLSAVAQFALSGLVATVLIGLIAVAVSRHIGTDEAIRDAKHVTRLAGKGVVEPALTPGVLAGDPDELRRLDRLVRENVRRDDVVRIKLWSAGGHVVYSDEPRLIGSTFAVDADERAALHARSVHAEVSNHARDENRFESTEGKLLEVYLPIKGPDGQPLVFEVYERFASVSASGGRLWRAFAPALIGGLLLLQLVNLPLAHSLARRLRRGRDEREVLLHRALNASHTERRRIAADLHDGVVQDLVGVTYALSAHAQRLNGHGDTAVTEALRSGAGRTRESVRALRTLLVEIYPPSVHRAGLHAALSDLARTSTARGVETTLEAPDDLDLDSESEQLLFRCAQEALRNAKRHTLARHAEIALRADHGRAVLEVTDDGTCFDGDGGAPCADRGLRFVRELVDQEGGVLDVRCAADGGTAMRVELPAR